MSHLIKSNRKPVGKTTKRLLPIAARSALLAVVCGLSAGSLAQSSFDEQRQAVSISPVTQSEAKILALLDSGLAEDKPTQAIAVTQKWLRENTVENPLLLYRAGQAAELSGDWKSASALYQQYLLRADMNSQSASDASLAVYALLINQLSDIESAYAYSRSDGNRLVANAQARQFDRWFLDEAKRRSDIESVAARLLALCNAKVPNDLLVAQYEADFNWLLHAIDNARLDNSRFSPRLLETMNGLANAITFDNELKLLLDWGVSVKAYNMAILAEEQTQLPIAQAQALLQAYPRYAERVQTGWAGGRGRHYRGDPKKYWPLDLEAKLAPVKAAVAKLDPATRAAYDQSLDPAYYSGTPQLLTVEEARAWVLANPKLANSKAAPVLALGWNKLTHEDAKKLASLLQLNPSPEAALIRAIAQATADDGTTKNFDKAVDVLLSTEAWRLGSGELNGSYADQLWHWAGRPGGNAKRDQQIARSKKIAQSIKKDTVKKEDPANKRLAEFKKLWQDYRSAQPKLPAVREQLLSTLRLTPEALPEVIRDDSVEVRLLLREALTAGISGSGAAWDAYQSAKKIDTDRYNSSFDELVRRHYGGLSRLINTEKYRAHPLSSMFQNLLADQVKRGKVESWVVFAWLNTQFPEDNADSIALMKQLMQAPAWKSLSFEARSGARQWFNMAAMTPTQAAIVRSADPVLICKPLLDLPEDADAPTTADAIKATLAGLMKSPVHHEILGLDRLAKIDQAVFSDPQVLVHIYELVGPMRSFQTEATFGTRLFNVVSKQNDADILHRTAAYLWRHTEVHHRTLADLITLSAKVADEHPSAANALARSGLQTIARHTRGHTYYKRETDIPSLTSVRGKATLAMGLVDIPVPKSHPAYGIYQSQAEFVIGNQDSAREIYADNIDLLLPVHRKLSVSYLLWALQYNIDNRDEQRQEELAKALMAWMQESVTAFSIEQRITLEIAYGDIALQRGLLPEAQQIFTRIASKPEYESVYTRHAATLRRVLVQRISGDYNGALETLRQLQLQKIPRLTTEAHYARAEVYYAMKDYQDAADEITIVLDRDPYHADATILRGRVQLKLQRLIEATEVELGSVANQASLVPGEVLKVTLNDPTLTVSSGGSDIEVVVTTTSGDEEFLLLRQFGDQKTKYRGEVPTVLGKPEKDDGKLQIVGDDEIYYAYSKRYREKMPNLGENRGGPITVASDAVMMASARKLLSENEQRVADMRAVTEVLDQRQNASIQNMDPEELAELKAEASARARKAALEARVKPGSPIYLRVVDLDRGRTAEVDQLAVNVSSSSGDSVGRIVLTETGTHTGTFEGQIQTTEAQALAFGSSSETGRNPNMVISPKADYPAWRPVASKETQHAFTVDLNDNAPIADLQIEANEQGFALKRFAIQTAMSGSYWTTVGTYPASRIALDNPWQPNITVVNEAGLRAPRGARSVYEQAELRQHLSMGWLAVPDMALGKNVVGPSQALPASVTEDIKWSWENGRDKNPAVVVRFQAYFYESSTVTRRFQLDLGKHNVTSKNKAKQTKPEFLIAVDGRVITSKDNGKLQGQIKLNPGVHRIEIWATGFIDSIGFGRSVKLLANLDDPEVWVACPDSMFDPASFPPGLLEQRNTPAQVESADNGKRFAVKFADGSRARQIRLLFSDFEGPVPSLSRLKLTDAKGSVLLPVPEDYAEQRKNDLLEIITGDRVTVRYVDDRFVTKGRQKHERFLNVAYTNGSVGFVDVQPRFSGRHNALRPYREDLLRFPHDTPLSVVVNDADMDVTTEPDRLTCTIVNAKGDKRELLAIETGPSTGVFRAWITPVAGETRKKDQIQVAEGGALTVTYRDAENLNPGVPYDRVGSIRCVIANTPRIEIGHMTVSEYEPVTRPGETPRDHTQSLNEMLDSWSVRGGDPTNVRRDHSDRIKARFKIDQKFLSMDEAPEGGLALVHGRMALIDVVAPHLALGASSTLEVFVQTDRGRAAAGVKNGRSFNPNVPGTIRVVGSMVTPTGYGIRERGGYVAGFSQQRGTKEQQARASREEGRFRLSLPLVTGPLPTISYADPKEIYDLKLRYPAGLAVKTGERVHIGVSYKDAQGNKQWATASAKVITRPMLDVLDEDYRTTRSQAHVGERLYLRVVDTAADKTDDRDALRVFMATKSGEKHYVTLRETDPHSGVFKGTYQLTFASKQAKDEAAKAGEDANAYDVKRMGFPVVYGDSVGVRYTDGSGAKTPVHYVTIAKGSDGTIKPFSKQYDDSETAMRTQFAMAESYLELARRHRKLGEEDSAKREFVRARQLLANTIAQFNDPETRAHAEYLLGNLTMEDAEISDDKDLQQSRYQAALARYMKVTSSYPDTVFASKSQFKIAVLYERLGEPDIAAQEYVKLAYKYPESEHLATAMARLGTHFQRKAITYEKQADPLLEQLENKDALFEGEALQKLARLEYVKAAQIFERLQERFPGHELAGKAGLRAGQIYMRAEEYRSALKALQAIVNNEAYDGATLRAEAMYWSGRCYESLGQQLQAYALFKRITYDFPESKWSAYARARLSTEQMINLDKKLEIERLEASE